MAHVLDGVTRGSILLLALIAPGCTLLRPRNGSTDPFPTAPGAELLAAECKGGAFPGSFLLSGTDLSARRTLAERIRRGDPVLFAVHADGCAIELAPLETCRVPGINYRRRDRKEGRRHIARTPEELFARLPIAARVLAARLARGSIIVETKISETWELPPGTDIRRESLQGGDCAKATHLLAAAHFGGDRLEIEPLAGSPEILATEGAIEGCSPGDACAPLPVAITVRDLVAAEQPPTPAQSMIAIAAGSFTRGSADGAPDERPPREIELGAFEIDRTEVSAASYDACVAQGKCTPPGKGELCTGGALGKERHPINCISWAQAEAYCRFVEKRLPTEAEWERAARSGADRRFVWGDGWPPPPGSVNLADDSAHAERPYWRTIEGYRDGFADTAPVEAFEKGDVTLQAVLQMGGNVAEWVADWYDPGSYAAGPAKDPQGPSRGKTRVIRGGSFGMADPERLRATHRSAYAPDEQSIHFGVRCAK